MALAPQPIQARLHEVDGLRGWAALSVMLAHLYYGVFRNLEPPLVPSFIDPFIQPFLGGTLDVAVFFVLSGDALSAAYWARRSRESVVRLAVKRYFRLGIPIFASCLIAFVLLKSGLTFNRPAASLLNVQDFMGNVLTHNFSLGDLLGYSALGVFFHHTPENSLNPILWPMQLELLGSGMVFFYLLSESLIRLKVAAQIFIFMVCLCTGSFLACFQFGVLCGYVRTNGGFDRLRRQPTVQSSAFLAAAVALVAGTYSNEVWQNFFPPIILAACIIVLGVYASTSLTRFFSTRLSRWLGRISFPLYLVHFAVIASFTSGMVMLADAHGGLNLIVVWLIMFLSAAVSLLAAVLFLPVEWLTTWIGNLVCHLVIDGKLSIGRVIALPTSPLSQPRESPVGD